MTFFIEKFKEYLFIYLFTHKTLFLQKKAHRLSNELPEVKHFLLIYNYYYLLIFNYYLADF